MASSSRSEGINQGHDAQLECPGCANKLKGDVRELPCGHCICLPCTAALETQTIQKCPVAKCRCSRTKFTERIVVDNLPTRPAAAVCDNFMMPPPPYTERPKTASVSYCDLHPSESVRFFCNECSEAICALCWEEKHSDWKKHNVSTMSIYMRPQKEVEARIAAYRLECVNMTGILQEWQPCIDQIQSAERAQKAVLKCKSARDIEQKSGDVRNHLLAQMINVQNYKRKILSQFSEIEATYGRIFGDEVVDSKSDGSPNQLNQGANTSRGTSGPRMTDNFTSSPGGSSVTGRSDGVSAGKKTVIEDKKKKVLTGVKETWKGDDIVECCKAVFKAESRELMCFKFLYRKITVLRLNDKNEKLEVKRTMEWEELREKENELGDITVNDGSIMYGVIAEDGGTYFKKVEELDQFSLKKKSELDTQGLLNGSGVIWNLTSFHDTLALLVYDLRNEGDRKWHSVTVYRNKKRMETVSLEISINGRLYWSVSALVNESTLLLCCGLNKIAVVTLPSQSHCHSIAASSSSSLSSSTTLKPQSIKYVIAAGVTQIYSLVWMPIESQLEGYICVGELEGAPLSRIYKINLGTDLAKVDEGKDIKLQEVENMSPLEKIIVKCPVDDHTVFATHGKFRREGQPVLLNFDFQPI